MIVLFAGPTLSAEEARAELPSAKVRPPAARGDLYRAALSGPRAIGLVDGYFERVPSVMHKEILWAMARGVHVWGSASMGALRAAELAQFGMAGVGAVYQAFAGGALTDDDEVAISHAEADGGYRALSEAMVNLRATVAAAEAAAVIAPATGAALVRIAKALFYRERAWPAVLARAADERLAPSELAALRAWLPSGRVDQKRADALAMLRAMRDHLAADPPPKQVPWHFEHTDAWEDLVKAREVTPPR